MSESATLQLHMRNSQKVIYNGEINSLTSYNQKGIFDILPSHSNFISMIKDKIIFTPSGGQKVTYPITTAIMRVTSNKVSIFFQL